MLPMTLNNEQYLYLTIYRLTKFFVFNFYSAYFCMVHKTRGSKKPQATLWKVLDVGYLNQIQQIFYRLCRLLAMWQMNRNRPTSANSSQPHPSTSIAASRESSASRSPHRDDSIVRHSLFTTMFSSAFYLSLFFLVCLSIYFHFHFYFGSSVGFFNAV